MAARLASSLFVSALVRRVEGAGAFAYVARRGSPESGAIHVLFREPRTGGFRFYVPAMQAQAGQEDLEEASGGRLFMVAEQIADDAALEGFLASEARFDPDFWLVEIEDWRQPVTDLLTLVPG